jgi:hypothetical protein
MTINAKTFLGFKSSRQIEYLNKDDFTHSNQKEKIEFLKVILKEELSVDTAVRALLLLKEMQYPDRYFFRKFLFHRNDSVSAAAREIIDELDREKNHCATFVAMLREGERDDLILLANYFITQKGKIDEKALLAFLCINDICVRDIIVKNVTPEHEIDDALLSAAITSGNAWYVRAALVEILGNRKSQCLFDCIDFLMNDKNVEVKLKLIDALSKLGEEKGKAYLQQLARDSIIWVRKHAHRALQGRKST